MVLPFRTYPQPLLPCTIRSTVLAMIAPMFYIVEHYLDPSLVSKTLGPLVPLLFMVKDRGVRGALLNKVNFLSQHLDKGVLNSQVFEPLCSGFNDSSPALRELTLKATIGLVPYLNPPNLEKLSRYLVRLQSDTETAIRTNAVIFIAKIAPSLSEISREKMLLPAYARAMKDTFTPCRMAALQSLGKSQELFSKIDLASKVLPVITPLLLDPMADVRTEAFQVVNNLLQVLEVESDRLAHLAQRQAAAQSAQQPAALGTATSAPTPRVPAHAITPSKVAPAPASASGSYLSGLSSWMSSSAQPDAPSTAARPVPAKPAAAPAMTVSPTPAPAAPIPVGPSSIAATTTQFAATRMAAPPAAIDDDMWGDEDGDGWGDEDDAIDEDPFSKLGTKTVQASPAPARITPSAKPTPAGFGDDDDPFAAIGMKTSALGSNAIAPKGKLVLPSKAGAIKLSKPAVAPATKLKLDKSEMGDGWDDF
jgi:SCY1-like protein 1